MGDSAHCCIILRFSAVSRETNVLDCLYPEIQQLRYVYEEVFNICIIRKNTDVILICISGGEFEAIRSLIHAEIKQEESSLNINAESNNPALLGEWLPITICLSANESINAVCLHVTLVADGSNEQSSTLSFTMFYF